MENPVDHPLDLGFVNYVQHPSNKDYVVFRFRDPARAADFEEGLTKLKCWFEKAQEEKNGNTIHLYGVHKNDFKKAQDLNFSVEGIHKKPIIKNRWGRYALLFFFGSALILASIGYCKRNEQLRLLNERMERIVNSPK